MAYGSHPRPVLPNRNAMRATGVILNFLVATLKKVKRNRLKNLSIFFNLMYPKYHFNI